MMKMNQQASPALPEKWEALWIDPELPHDPKERQPSSLLRRQFTCKKAKAATLFITCHGLYVARINGRRMGDFCLAPGTGDYHKRLTVQSFDVTDLLIEGENELTVTLGDGWYRGSVGIDALTNYYGTDIALLCQLEVDGQVILRSDESWEASQDGPIRENDLQQGETYDARKEEGGCFHPVTIRDFGYENLAPTQNVPIIEQERFPGEILITPNGETVIDFGQNLAGYTEVSLNAHEGQKLTLWHGETLDENGNFTQKNFDPGDRNKNGGITQKVTYICREGKNSYKPSFAFFGFRYVKLETDIPLTESSFTATAIAVYSFMPQTGFFTCGSKEVNQLFHNSLWSMRSNFCDIPTDCPTRERAGWTGDAQVFAPTAVYLADCYSIFRKWLGECRLAQGEDGLVQNIAPVNNAGGMISGMLQGSAGWGDACILVPWALYQAYGRVEILEENYEMMKGWISFCTKRASKTRPQNLLNPYHKYLVDEGFHFGEWCQPDVDNQQAMKKTMMFGAPEVATAYYARSAFLLSQIAKILGKGEDEKEFSLLAKNAKKAYRYTCTKKGSIHSDRQCEYVRPIAFGLLSREEAQKAADELDELVRKNGFHLNTGFLSTPDLCRVLSEHGHTDTAYRLLLQEECPGWLYALSKGATTIWETWDGVREDGTVHDSLNHYSYGAITGWLFGGVCGIRLSAGYLFICPRPHPSLGFARARWESPVGRIVSSWEYKEGKLLLDITLPIPGTITLPDGKSFSREAGDYHFEISEEEVLP